MANTNCLGPFDIQMMAQALKLASRGKSTCMPNPVVGCVLVKNGDVLSEGWHAIAGEGHAEINALNAAGEEAHGSTAYVTLEPCCHYGRTPPCVDALIAAGVVRVVFGATDPDPKISGNGLAKLKKAGILVEGPLLEAQAQQLNQGYIKRHQCGQPWVTVKLAMSVDGRTAMDDGTSQWITGFHARQDVQRLRANCCAIITGVGTVLSDNPSLTVRCETGDDRALGEQESPRKLTSKQPLRVIVDSQLKTPVGAKVLSLPGRVLVASAVDKGMSDHDDVETISLPNNNGEVDLTRLLKVLAEKGCNNVLIEAGSKLAGEFMLKGLVDELIIYMAPKLLGSMARPLFNLPFASMDQQIELDITDIRQVGNDWRITASPNKN